MRDGADQQRLRAAVPRLSNWNRRLTGANRRERRPAALAACGIGRSTMPDARPALRTGPRFVERLDALQRGSHLACAGPAAASMDLDVQCRPDIRLQVLEQRLDRVQQGFARSFRVRRTPLSSSPISRLSFAWPRRKGSGAHSASHTSCSSSSSARRALVAAP